MHSVSRRLAWRIGAALACSTCLLAAAGPESARTAVPSTVTSVSGSAYGYYLSVSLFGGPADTRGPAPSVTLPSSGGGPFTATSASATAQVGPAIFFSSGSLQVSTQGTTGVGGSATSSTDIMNVNSSGQEVFTASRVQSSCTASESGSSGSTTITNGVLRTSEGNPNVSGDEVYVNIPTNPAPNSAYNGQNESVGDSFQYIFNEQTVNPDGSLTVYAAHQRLLGPTAVGDLYIGKAACGVTSAATAVALRSFTATAVRAGALLRWRTATEIAIAGFDLYRVADGTRVKVNRRLIPAHGRGRYSRLDRGAPAGKSVRYWLDAVSLDGTRTRYGPAALTQT